MSRLVRVGGWLFRRRTSLPIPLALALLVIPTGQESGDSGLLAIGAVIVCAGELLRLWAVRHIGVISRTRSDRLGPLVSSGPFGFVRNPLYLGIALGWRRSAPPVLARAHLLIACSPVSRDEVGRRAPQIAAPRQTAIRGAGPR